MIPSAELPAAISHVAGGARRHLLVVAPRVDDVVLDFIRASVTPGVEVEVRQHPRVKAVIAADQDLALVLSGSLTPAGTGIAFVQEVEGAQPNIEGGRLINDPTEVAWLIAALR